MENEFIEKNLLDKKELKAKTKKKTKQKKASKGPSALVQILNGDFMNGDFIIKNFNYFFFIMFLLLLLVGKSHYAKQLKKDVKQTQKELDEATSDYFEAKAKLEEETRRAELIEKLDKTGLKETVNPTKVIRLKKETK